MISGYLMTAIIMKGLDRGTFSVLSFYRDRAARIIPALAAMVGMTLVLGWFLVDPLVYRDMASYALSTLLFVSNAQYFFTSGYFSPAAEKIWYLHSWSLSVEWQFYLIYPLLLIVARRWMPRQIPWVIAGSAALLFAIALALQSIGTNKAVSFVFYVTPFRAPEMLLGGIVFVFGHRLPRSLAKPVEWAGIAMIIASCMLFDRSTPWPSFWWLIPGLGTAMTIAADRQADTILRFPILQRLGDWSYSIYLWHWPLLAALTYAQATTPVTLTAGFLVSLLLGYLSYRSIEIPARRFVRSATSVRLIAAATGIGATAAACALIWWTNGVPQRLPEVQAAAIEDALRARGDFGMPNRCDGRLCTLEGGSPAEVLVIGDSHAQMFYPRMEVIAKAEGRSIDILTMGGCPPGPQIAKISAPECAAFNRSTAQQALEGRYSRIVVIAAWYAYFEVYPHSQVCLAGAGTCELIRTPQAAQAALTSFETFIQLLRKKGKEVVIVAHSPIYPIDIPEQISRQSFWPNKALSLTAFPFNLAKQDPGGVDAAFRSLQQDGVRIVDPHSSTCSNGTCRLVDAQGRSLFVDNNHLRSYAARDVSGLDVAFH